MKKVLFLGIISFIFSALWFLPLTVVKPYAEKMINGLKLENESGTLWKGEVQQLTVQNTKLGNVSWNVLPLQSLISLSLKSKFNINGNDLVANGIAGLTLGEKLILNNTQFDLNASYLNKLQKNAKLSGNIKGNIKHAEIDQQAVPQINGVIDWKNGAVNSPIKLEPGDYRATITPVSGNLDIKLTSNEAPVELNGDLTLNKDWTFITNLIAKANNQGLTAMLKLAGKQQADGTVLINKKGNLKPFIGR